MLLITTEANLQQLTRLDAEQVERVVQAAAEIVVASKLKKGLYHTI